MPLNTPNACPPLHTPAAIFRLENAARSKRRVARIAIHCEQAIGPEDGSYLGNFGQALRDIDRAADQLVVAFGTADTEIVAPRELA